VAPLEAALERARQADVLEVAERLGAQLKKVGSEWVGPCPRCGGRDRFAVSARKRLFNCRGCEKGGDATEMVRLVLGGSLSDALEFINGLSVHLRRPLSVPAKKAVAESGQLASTGGDQYEPDNLQLATSEDQRNLKGTCLWKPISNHYQTRNLCRPKSAISIRFLALLSTPIPAS
jgi:phage/plasmid primase-like uncharacterized protein